MKRIISIVLALTLLISVFACIPFAVSASEIDVWEGEIADSFAGGTGTETDPYLISTPEQLAHMLFFGTTTTGQYYRLTTDIYLNDVSDADWASNSPNSWYDRENDMKKVAFVGNLDGNGYTIHGLYYNGTGIAGLLPQASNTTVTNLRISNADITSVEDVGAIVSFGQNSITIKRSIVDETVKLETTGTGQGISGFMAYGSPKVYVYDSAFMASITSTQIDGMGAFMGAVWGNTAADRVIENSFSAVDIRLLGHQTQGFTVENVYTVGTESEQQAITGTVTKLDSVDMMKGADAKTNMPGLDWTTIWQTTESGYPVHRPINGVKGEVWSGLVANAFAGGSGTAADPYLIETPEQLAKMLFFGTTTTGKYYKLTADIYLNDVSDADWASNSPNSWYDRAAINKTAFVGNLDGDKYTIHGLYYNGTDYAGLFAQASDTTVTNLRISNADITSSASVAAIVAFGQNTITIEKSIVDETVKLVTTGTNYPAGFVGYGTPKIYIYDSGVMAQITGAGGQGAFMGSIWGNTAAGRVIERSFSAIDLPLLGHPTQGFTVVDVYNVGTESEKQAITGTVTKIDNADMMKGTAAKTNMPALDWTTVWMTTEGYPTYREATDGTEGEAWGGMIAENYAGGTGTSTAPYLIATAEQLAKLVTEPADAGQYYKLIADIIVNDTTAENWKESALQWYAYNKGAEFANIYFQGTLDGDGHSISGLYYDGSDFYVGLFAGIKNNATIKNVIIKDSYLASSNATGSVSVFTGFLNGPVNYEKCVIDSSVTVSGGYASGFGGWGSGKTTINNCASYANITGLESTASFIANIWSTPINISNSIGVNVISSTRAYNGANNYSLVADEYGTNVITVEQMTGADAKDNMPLLSWNDAWFTTDGYPTPFGTSVACDHIYENDCDFNCNTCGAHREVGDHVYDDACDADCNICAEEREAPHNYAGVCDTICDDCGVTREVSEDVTHTYDNNCDADCNVCGDVREVGDHTYETVTVDATCTEGGSVTYTCTVCGGSYVEVITAVGHKYESVYTDPTFDDDAYTTYTCSVCGDSYVETHIDTQLVAEAVANGQRYETLAEAMAQGGEVTLLKDVEIDGAIVVDNTVVLNLAGFSVSTTENDKSGDGVFCVVADGDLTINGDGTINGVGGNDYNIAIWANGGKVTIYGGTYTNVGATDSTGDTHFDLIYVKNGGEVIIYGGKFIAENADWTLNSHDTLTGTIKVYGGEFVGYNPMNNKTEGEGTDWMAEGYHAADLDNDGIYTVHEAAYEAVVTDPTCTEDGYTTYTCSICGDTYVADEVTALGHTEVIDAAVDATCTETGLTEGKHCDVCGEVIIAQEKVAATGHTYGEWIVVTAAKPGVAGLQYKECACGDKVEEEIVIELVKLSSANLTLFSTVTINYYVNASFLETYSDIYVVCVFEDKEYVLKDYVVSGENIVFSFNEIAPDKLNKTVTATVYAEFDGEIYECQTKDYSAVTYVQNMLPEATGEFATLLVDFVNYGAATQEYTGFETDNLANAWLTEEQKLLGTQEDRETESVLNTKYAEVEEATAKWRGANLYLKDSIAIKYMVNLSAVEDMTGLTAVFEAAGETWTIPVSEFTTTNNVYYYVTFDKLDPSQLSETVLATICKDGVAISNTVSYSVESYVDAKRNDADETVANLAKALLRYGDAAYAYVN